MLSDQQCTLQGYLAALVQSSTSTQTASENIFGDMAKPKSHAWSDLNNYGNLKVFSGDSKGWEEFADKLKGLIMVGSPMAAEVVEHVETKVSEASWRRRISSSGSRWRGARTTGCRRLHTSCTTCS